ncbi:MAG: hypothetical protein FWC83_00390, partial [Alphaproteobacteria bacterium]|nr:hypothetical protein [Alphaproteobacteria bacterium]
MNKIIPLSLLLAVFITGFAVANDSPVFHDGAASPRASRTVVHVPTVASPDAFGEARIQEPVIAARTAITRQEPAPAPARAPTVARSAQEQAVARGAVRAPEPAVAARTAVAVRATEPTTTRTMVGGQQARSAIPAQARAAIAQQQQATRGTTDAAARRAGISQRPSVARDANVVAAELNRMAASDAQVARAAISPIAIADMGDHIAQVSEITLQCQQQFMDCMDQFCNVIDANQQRCSCSARLTEYAAIERAVRDANNELNEVAQRIRYIGLTADEIRSIMSATEAEMALGGQTDRTANRELLNQIELLIRSPDETVQQAQTGFGLDIDINFEFGGDVMDMFNVNNMFGGGNNAGSFANMRGTQLFNQAQNRCRAILDNCRRAGADMARVEAYYQMAIDRDCIAFETGLERMNNNLRGNVRAAIRMLEQARLSVMQSHNELDARGCVAALEQCMTDPMVCGNDYVKCLDPSKQFIDENGRVVLGQDITRIRSLMRDATGNPFDAQRISVNPQQLTDAGTYHAVIRYLLGRIGTGQEAISGLCRGVMNRCRAVTHDRDGRFNPENDVIRLYIQRAMVGIRAGQERIIADFASTCLQDLATCYTAQMAQVNLWASGASAQSIHNIMRGACRNVALTCGFAVFPQPELRGQGGWNADRFIDEISEVFAQSMLCTMDNATLTMSGFEAGHLNNGLERGWANNMCRCNAGFAPVNGQCVPWVDCPRYSSLTGLFNAQAPSPMTATHAVQPCRCVVRNRTTGDLGCPACPDGAPWNYVQRRCVPAEPCPGNSSTTFQGMALPAPYGHCSCPESMAERFVVWDGHTCLVIATTAAGQNMQFTSAACPRCFMIDSAVARNACTQTQGRVFGRSDVPTPAVPSMCVCPA